MQRLIQTDRIAKAVLLASLRSSPGGIAMAAKARVFTTNAALASKLGRGIQLGSRFVFVDPQLAPQHPGLRTRSLPSRTQVEFNLTFGKECFPIPRLSTWRQASSTVISQVIYEFQLKSRQPSWPMVSAFANVEATRIRQQTVPQV